MGPLMEVLGLIRSVLYPRPLLRVLLMAHVDFHGWFPLLKLGLGGKPGQG